MCIRDRWYTVKDPWHTTKDPWHTAKDPWHTAKDPWYTDILQRTHDILWRTHDILQKKHEILRKAYEILQRSMELLQYTVWHRKHGTSNDVSNWNENTTCTLNTACIQSNRCYLNKKIFWWSWWNVFCNSLHSTVFVWIKAIINDDCRFKPNSGSHLPLLLGHSSSDSKTLCILCI